MRIPKPIKIGVSLTMLAAAIATPFTLSQLAQTKASPVPTSTQHHSVKPMADPNLFPLTIGPDGKHKKHPKPGKPGKSGKISIDPGPIQETTDGNFVSTVFGDGLKANSYYDLTDNNTSCADSINASIFSIRTDLNGRFEYPFYSLNESPCSTGKYTITAVGTSNDAYKTSVTIEYAHTVTPQIVVAPNTVVSTTTGSFATSVYVYGLHPYTTYYIYDDFNCKTSIYNYYSNKFQTDNAGNAEISLFGGPDFYSTSAVCSPGLHTVFVYAAGGSQPIYTGHVTLSVIHH